MNISWLPMVKLMPNQIIQKINSRIAPRDLKEPRKLLLSLNSRMLRRGTHLLLYSPFRLSDQLSLILSLLFNSSQRKTRIKRRRGLRLLNLLAHYPLRLRWTLKCINKQKQSKETWWHLRSHWISSCKASSRVMKRKMTLGKNLRPIQLISLSLRRPLLKILINSRDNSKMRRSTCDPITIMHTMLPQNPYMSKRAPSNHQLKRSKNVTRYNLKIQIMKHHISNNMITLRHNH